MVIVDFEVIWVHRVMSVYQQWGSALSFCYCAHVMGGEGSYGYKVVEMVKIHSLHDAASNSHRTLIEIT